MMSLVARALRRSAPSFVRCAASGTQTHSLLLVCSLLLGGPSLAFADDGQVEQGGDRFKPNPDVLSPPELQDPIYACANTVVVKGFVPHAILRVFVSGDPNPIGSDPDGEDPDKQPVGVSIHFTAGQIVSAVQVVGSTVSGPSNTVRVKNYLEDYPSGLPQPMIDPSLCLDCGLAVGIAGAVPGATWTVFAETPQGNGFGPPVKIGGNQDFPYTFVSPQLKAGQRLTAQQSLCSDTSPVSLLLSTTVQKDPTTIPAPVVDPVFQNADRVVVRGPGGTNPNPLDGAMLSVFADYGPPPKGQIGGQPTAGGAGQQVLINPHAPAGMHTFTAEQALCTPSGQGPPTPEQPCSALPAAQIRSPIPGDTTVQVTESVPGSEILIFVTNGGSTKQIGAGGGSEITLSQPIATGDTVTVTQELGSCQSNLVYVAAAGCNNVDPNVCSADWPAFHHSAWRDGQQTNASVLADPDKVRSLHPSWHFTPPDNPQPFKASPIVFQGRVFIGNGNGRFYALDAATGKRLWEFPKPPAPALLSKYAQANAALKVFENPSSAGIASSASIALIENERPIVVFAAPDPSLGAMLGSGRLFALDPATGNLVWHSPEIAVVNGLTSSRTNEAVAITQRHENLGYSSPLVVGNMIYVGIADHGDDPIQAGRLVAVDANTGNPVGGFSFASTGARGGGIWSAAAGGLDKDTVAITTGNSANWSGGQQPEPVPDNALSMLGLNGTTGSINWKLRAVPFDDDNDPDWAAGPALLDARCGHVAASTQKDGWTYAARLGSTGGGLPGIFWQFPPTGIPFPQGDMRHADTRYIRAGAGWDDTYITMDGGYDVESSQSGFGFTRLHALDTCAPSSQPVRWVADIPDTTVMQEYQLGSPTVTRGIVFIGTAGGHLVVLADPSVYASAYLVCSNPEISNANCAMAGFSIVQRPIQLTDVDLGAGSIQTEPALAGGRVFVATDGGQVIMLQP